MLVHCKDCKKSNFLLHKLEPCCRNLLSKSDKDIIQNREKINQKLIMKQKRSLDMSFRGHSITSGEDEGGLGG